jgi:hypothetical protein
MDCPGVHTRVEPVVPELAAEEVVVPEAPLPPQANKNIAVTARRSFMVDP